MRSADRCYERLRVAYVAAKDRYIMFFQPGGVFGGKGEYAHTVAARLEGRDEMAP
jgi:hypothetical protein